MRRSSVSQVILDTQKEKRFIASRFFVGNRAALLSRAEDVFVDKNFVIRYNAKRIQMGKPNRKG